LDGELDSAFHVALARQYAEHGTFWWDTIHYGPVPMASPHNKVRTPSLWRKTAATSGFVPGLLPNRFPFTNRRPSSRRSRSTGKEIGCVRT